MIISNYVRDGLIFMVHPVYAHICMMMRIIYVECKNKEDKIFTFRCKCYTDIASMPFKTNKTAQRCMPVVYVFEQKVQFSAIVQTLRMITMGPREQDVDCSRSA